MCLPTHASEVRHATLPTRARFLRGNIVGALTQFIEFLRDLLNPDQISLELPSGIIIVRTFRRDGSLRSAILKRNFRVFENANISDVVGWLDCSPHSESWQRLVSACTARDFSRLPDHFSYKPELDRVSFLIPTETFTISVDDVLKAHQLISAKVPEKKIDRAWPP